MFLCSYNKRNEATVLNNIADIYCYVTRLHSNVIRSESNAKQTLNEPCVTNCCVVWLWSFYRAAEV